MKTKGSMLWTKGCPFWDIILKAVGQDGKVERTFKGHRLLLGMGCQKFHDEILASETQNGIQFYLEISDMSASMLEIVLEFIYTEAIGRATKWPEVGGLLSIAKKYGIPRLSKYCWERFESGLGQTSEQVIELFLEFTSLAQEHYKFPEEYYMEIVKLCLSYMLRNGEVILKSSSFSNLKLEHLELIFGSDYLCVRSEMSVFQSLLRWAKVQCRMKILDPNNMENIKEMLKKSDEGKESFGLLKYIRFPLFSVEEFESVNQPTDDIILTKNVEELVHRYHASKEPTGIFSEKQRPVQVDEQDEDFQEHLDQLLCNLQN